MANFVFGNIQRIATKFAALHMRVFRLMFGRYGPEKPETLERPSWPLSLFQLL